MYRNEAVLAAGGRLPGERVPRTGTLPFKLCVRSVQ